MCSKLKDIRPILKKIFPSAEMAEYLARCPFDDDLAYDRGYGFDDAPPERLPLRKYYVAEAVAGAVISLKRKRELFLQLAEGEDDGFFSSPADMIQQALQEMQPKPGEFFYLKSYTYDEDKSYSKKRALEPYLTWEHIFERIEKYLGDLEASERELAWFQVEKWSPDGTGRLKNDYDYTIIGTEVCYFSRNNAPYEDRVEFDEYHDLNFPVPFHAGDIVTVDCRPFAPVSHAVILEIGDNWDCCCLQALFRESDGTWDTGAVKHGSIFPGRHTPGLSPLYRLASFQGQLPEEERLLETVSRYIDGDEEYGSALWNYIFDLRGDRLERPVTEAQILSYIADDEGAEKDDI